MCSSDLGPAQTLRFTTSVGDDVDAGADHPIRVEFRGPEREPRPYVHVRGKLEALISRAVFYELVGIAEEREAADGGTEFVVHSNGCAFSLGSLNA